MSETTPWYDRVWYTVAVSDPNPVAFGVHERYQIKAWLAPGETLSLAVFGQKIAKPPPPPCLPSPPFPASFVPGDGSQQALAKVLSAEPVSQWAAYIQQVAVGIQQVADERGEIDCDFELRDALFSIDFLRLFSPDEGGEIQILADGIGLFAFDRISLDYLREHRWYAEHSWRRRMERILEEALYEARYGEEDDDDDYDDEGVPRERDRYFFRRVA
jgi:hypothetical protein